MSEYSYCAEWDAGSMGCGELLMLLSTQLKSLNPGDVLKLTAQDTGAIEDLPAWCTMTGHLLRQANHPIYFIERKRG